MGQYNHLSCPVLDSDRSELNEEEKKELFQKCILMVDVYVKSHIHNLDDAHNLRQEILLKALEAFDKSYHERGRFRAWVLTIAMNMVRDYYRKKQREPRIIFMGNGFLNFVYKYKSRPLIVSFMYNHACEVLTEAIMELSSTERKLIDYVFFHKLGYRRASEELHISKSACFKRSRSILLKLRFRLGEKGIDQQSLNDNL